MVEGGRGVCWADQKEEAREESSLTCPEGVTLSPLTEADVRLDVPPSSVLCLARRAPVVVEEVDDTPAPPSNLDATVVLHSVDLDSTFDVHAPVVPPEPIFKVELSKTAMKVPQAFPCSVSFQIPVCPVETHSSPMPLTDLISNVRPSSNVLPNVMYMSPAANKENVGLPKTSGTSSIPVRTPSKESKLGGTPHTPKLRKGHMFSKSSSDLSSQRSTKPVQPGYMAATTASKFRESGQEQQQTAFLEPLPPSASAGQSSRFATNPFK